MISKEEMERREAIVSKHLNELGEWFECVQILTSSYDSSDKSTVFVFKGIGNQFARNGMAREMIRREDFESKYTFDQEKNEDNE